MVFGGASGMVDMLVKHVPSAKKATAEKVTRHYSGPLDPDSLLAKCMIDATPRWEPASSFLYEDGQREGQGRRSTPCPTHPTQSQNHHRHNNNRVQSPRGPLVFHVAKLYPKQDGRSFDALGRIISGTIRPGDRVSRLFKCSNSDACCSKSSFFVRGAMAYKHLPTTHQLTPDTSKPHPPRSASWARATPRRTRRTAPSRRSQTSGSTRWGGRRLGWRRGQGDGGQHTVSLPRLLKRPSQLLNPVRSIHPHTPHPPHNQPTTQPTSQTIKTTPSKGALPPPRVQGHRRQPRPGGGPRRRRGKDGDGGARGV